MTQAQKIIKYLAIAFAFVLIIGIVSSVVGIFSRISSFGDSETGERRTLDVSGEVRSLDLDLAAVELIIQSGDALSVETNNQNISASVRNGTLSIEERTPWFSSSVKDAVLILTLPGDAAAFETVDIDAGAGKITIDSLQTDVLEFDIGAGDVQIDFLSVTRSAKINGGAGQMTIRSGSIRNLDLDAGVGQVTIRVELLGDSDIDMGVGEMNVTLIGSVSDYTVTMDKGLGSATLDGEKMQSGTKYGSGPNRLDIDGGVGSIRIRTESLSGK